MTIHELFDAISNLIQVHWAKAIVSIGFLLVGLWWGRYRSYRKWIRREFLNSLNISLNSLRPSPDDEHGPLLQIRTLIEKDMGDIFLNRAAVRIILAAARRTTEANPILPLDNDDRWYLHNAVLNEISERFADGFVKRDMGIPVTTEEYILSLTHECAGEVKTRKVRALVIAKKDLLALPEQFELESSNHQTRVKTLKYIAKEYKKDPSQFLEVEICI